MTAEDFRKIDMNIRLKWLIHESRIDQSEYKNFTLEELKHIQNIAEDKGLILEEIAKKEGAT